jgi:hypothetical protein
MEVGVRAFGAKRVMLGAVVGVMVVNHLDRAAIVAGRVAGIGTLGIVVGTIEARLRLLGTKL